MRDLCLGKHQQELQQKESMEVIECSTCTTSSMCKGWALKEQFARRGGSFNAKQLHFLNRTFQDGALNSSAKASPTTAAKMMRSLEYPVAGDKVFQQKEWLKESQIKSFFSRCYTAQKKSGAALFVRFVEKTRRGNFRWPCKCGKDMSEWICCEKKGCRKVTWIDNDTVIKRLDSGENVKDVFSFKM